MGVDVFFVLSGYLITHILTDEARRGPIDLFGFWERRLRRLLPALLFMVAATLAVSPWLLHHHLDKMPLYAALAATYTTNFAQMRDATVTPLLHTWSLGVEMQFYLLWPLVLSLLLKSARPITWLVVSWALATALHGVLFVTLGDPGRILTLRGAGLLLGAAIALSPPLPGRFAYLGAAGLVATLWPLGGHWDLAQNLLIAPAAALLIGGLANARPLRLALAVKPLVILGVLSYGIYLWHFPVAVILYKVTDWTVKLPVVLLLSIWFATLSHLTVERWFKSRRPKTTASAPQPSPEAAE